MEERRVRICDLAEERGLSTATVANVIHGKTKKVSDATVQRVTALLEEREYIPNMAGILLAQNDSRIIGVFVNDLEKYEGRTLSDFFIAESLNELSTQIEKTGRFMMVKKVKEAGQILRFASMWNMEGIVVIGFCAQDYRRSAITCGSHSWYMTGSADRRSGSSTSASTILAAASRSAATSGRWGIRARFACPTMRRASTATGSRAFSAALRRDTRSCCGSRCKKMHGGRTMSSSWSGCGA